MKGAFLFLLAFGCDAANPVSTNATNNPRVPVSLLLEHDGCKVYRFEDYYQYRYFVKCASGEAAALGAHTEKRGKTRVTITEEVPTVTVRP